MINIRSHIPNTITCLNLFSGCVACVMAFKGDYALAALFIYIAAVFDFFDGFAARILKAYSAIGKELDSLADCISFGFAPGVIMFSLLGQATFPDFFGSFTAYIPYLGFLISVFSALRLAKFNIDERQTSSFIGLPTPACCIFVASLAYALPSFLQSNGIWLLVITFLLSYLLVAEIPMFSLKMKSLKWKDNFVQYIFLLLSVLIIVVGRLQYLYLIIVLYIIISVLMALVGKKEK
jgi:CDP-diacylglycerol--serine O-phosphatidyltransferase